MQIDNERQHAAREYARVRLRITFIKLGLSILVLAVILLTSLDKWLRTTLQHATTWFSLLGWQPRPEWFPVQIIAYLLIILIAYELLMSPFTYYSGFVLPHRYGISVMTLKAWLNDLGKGTALNLILEAVFVTLIYGLLAVQPQLWWLWSGLIILVFTVLMANLAPIIIYPLFYKFTPMPEGELTRRLLALAARANTRVQGVFLMKMSDKTTATNAALMGLGNTRRIVMGDTMTEQYTPDEIEVVLAHELGHHVHRDIWKLIMSQTLLTLGGLYIASLLLHWIIDVQHYYRSLTDPATLPALFALIALFGLVVLPITNGYSRHIEYQADEYALQSTLKVAAFKSAMTRLANQNLAEIEPAPLVEFFFHSHPSIGKRLKHADEFATRPAYSANASLSADS